MATGNLLIARFIIDHTGFTIKSLVGIQMIQNIFLSHIMYVYKGQVINIIGKKFSKKIYFSALLDKLNAITHCFRTQFHANCISYLR